MKHGRYGATETTAALKAFLASHREFAMVDLYDIALATIGYPDKLILRYCDQPFDVRFPTPDFTTTTLATYAGGKHVAAGGTAEPAPKFVRGQRKEVLGVEVDTLDLDILLDGTDYLPAADGGGGTPRFGLDEAIRAGLFDGAHVVLRRLVLPALPVYPIEPTGISNRGDLGPGDTSLGAIVLFGGFITESSVTRSKAMLKVRAALERLSVGMPRNIFQAGCLYDLYDGRCRVSRTGSFGGNSFQVLPRVSTAVQDDPLNFVFLTTSYPTDTAFPQPGDYFKFGTLQFTTGVLAGVSRSVVAQGVVGGFGYSYAQFLKPLPRAPAAGDTCLLQAGCAKTIADCRDKFDNYVSATTQTIDVEGVPTSIRVDGLRFGGMPRVPPPDSAV